MTWYDGEGKNPHWAALAKERGFASWADWRLNGYARRFECEQAEWGFYEVANPAIVVSEWLGGPFRTWIEKYYDGEKTKTFAELASQSAIAELSKMKAIAENYQVDSIITALELSDGRLFVVEGMHRACALALMLKEDLPAPEKLIFAIGKSKLSELPPVGQNTSS